MKKPNTTGIRVFVSTRLQPPKKPLSLIFETRLPIPYTRALMIAYERLENVALETVPVIMYDMRLPYGDRGFAVVPPLPNPDTCKHRGSPEGFCFKCWKEIS